MVPGVWRRARHQFQNETPLVLTVPAISVQGSDFALLAAAPSGQALQPGQGGEFTIVFTPQTTGARQGSLTIGDRSYPLLGTGVDPPLPKPMVSLDLKQTASAQQGTLIVRFDAPAQTRGTGTATLDFQRPRRRRHRLRFGRPQRHVSDRAGRCAGRAAISDRDHRRRAHLHRASRGRERPAERDHHRRCARDQRGAGGALGRRRGDTDHRL